MEASEMAKKWFVWEKIRRIHPMQTIDFLTYISNFPKPAVPVGAGAKYEEKNIELLAVEDDFMRSGKHVAEVVMSNAKWFADYLDSMDKTADEYFALARKILSMDVSDKSNEELAAVFMEMHDSYLKSHVSGLIALLTEFIEEFISSRIKALLERKIKEKKLALETGRAFALLSQPAKESVLVEEKRAFLQLLDRLLQDKKLAALFRENEVDGIEKMLPAISPEFDSLLTGHWKKYQWIFFMYEGPALERTYFVKQLKENLDSAMYLAMELEKNKKIPPAQKKLITKLADAPEEEWVFSFPRRLIETKAYRKDAMYFGSFVFDRLCRKSVADWP